VLPPARRVATPLVTRIQQSYAPPLARRADAARPARAGRDCLSTRARTRPPRRAAPDRRRGGRRDSRRPDPPACAGAYSSPAAPTCRPASSGLARPQRIPHPQLLAKASHAARPAAGSGPLRAGGRSGERERAPSLMLRRGAFLSLRAGHLWQRSLSASALGRTRGRVTLPLLPRRSGGAPDPPGGGPGDGSRYQCAVAGATAARRSLRPARRRARGRFGPGGPKRRNRARAIPYAATGGFSFAPRGPFVAALPWRQRLGADPRTGRATSAPSPARRRAAPLFGGRRWFAAAGFVPLPFGVDPAAGFATHALSPARRRAAAVPRRPAMQPDALALRAGSCPKPGRGARLIRRWNRAGAGRRGR